MLTINDLKAHLNLDSDEDDALLTAKLAAATAYCTAYVGREIAAPDFDEAILRLAASFYENREDGEIPAGVVDLLRGLRNWTF